MINFKSIEWSNFLSTGNSPNKVLLNKSSTTLIIGKNGEGKSTILDALCFSLFGKPFRNINKGQLINSINQKKCLVEIEFEISGKEYVVKRGIKPNIFEIYQNGELLNQDAAIRDYQKVLEQQILKLNYKTFTQVVILGSASFVPFMQLPSLQRREVIEDILDIGIFSTMNQLLKDKVNDTKAEIQKIETEITNAKTKVELQSSIIKTISEAKADNIRFIQEKIATNVQEIERTQSDVDVLIEEIATLKNKILDKGEVEAELKRAESIRSKLHNKIETIESHKEFFDIHDICPSCDQGIPHEHKLSIISSLNATMSDQNEKVAELEIILKNLNKRLQDITTVLETITNKNIELSTKNSAVSVINKQISAYEKEIESYQTDTSNIDEEKRKLKELAKDAMAKLNSKTSLQEHRNLQEVSSILLKDTGIKTAIIREYLPIMNKLINKYLNAMDAYIHFELDEAFNESVKSRFRDDFTYASFSEGEKQKIDLAILFTWRQIAKLKNSVNTNLLIMDEIFDSSLDTQGTELLMTLLGQVTDDTNVFIISHKGDQLFDKFRSVIKFEKRNDFSIIVKA